MVSTEFFLIAAGVVTVIQVALVLFGIYGERSSVTSSAIVVAVAAFVCAYAIPQVLVYMIKPPFMGGLFGGWGIIVMLYLLSQVIPSSLAIALSDKMDDVVSSAGLGFGVGIVVFILLAVLGGIVNSIGYAVQNWGDANAQAKVNFSNVTVAKGYQDMPTTDPTHIVLVTKAIAAYEGQQAISQNGQNLGSTFHTESDQYTLQSVNTHLYWIAPLTYNNTQNQAQNADTPGYVMVDAENPNAQAVLVQKDKLGNDIRIHYVIGGFMDRDVYTHLYYHGFMNCALDDATLEIDDNLTPWYTVTCMKPIPGNAFYPYAVQSVILMNPMTGATQTFKLGSQPKWIDRVISTNTANQLVGDWTRFKYAPWFQGTSLTNELKPTGDPEILYNYTKNPTTGVVSDAPVFAYQITSNSDTDTTSTGFLLYDTQNLKGTYYPLGGVTVGGTVNQVFAKAPGNLRNYDVGSVQFYNLYGAPSWVAIYQQTNDYGATFQSVGIVNAQHLDGANVIMADNINDALSGYQTWLATAGSKVQNGTTASNAKTLTGAVTRITQVTENGKTVFYLMLAGSGHVFKVDATLPGFQPNTQVGDKVRVEYIETVSQTVSVSAFDNLTIDALSPTTTPTATPSN